MSKVLVEVTQEDIDKGRRYKGGRRGEFCPVARALRRGTTSNRVTVGFVRATVQGRLIELPLPAIVFIEMFDRDKPVSPFSFEIELPEVTP